MDDRGRAIIKAFNSWAADYDEWYTENPSLASIELRTVSLLKPWGRGIEVGGGSGFFSLPFQAMVLEPAMGMASLANQRGLDVVIGIGEQPPIRDSSMNYVLLVVTLCFLEDPMPTLSSARSLLKQGGALITCIVPRESRYGRLYEEKGRSGHRFYSLARFYSVKETIEMLRSIKLEIEPLASASLGNEEEPKLINPMDAEDFGFVCIKAIKKTA
ncbi:MAG: methyltransferase domain-containing protein [Thermocladium sp.]|jgi:SAM-dependent methyltransferase